VIKEEQLTRRKALKRVNRNISLLKSMPETFKSIYEVSFINENFTLFNLVNNAGIKEVTYKEAKDKIIVFSSFFKNAIKTENKYVGILLENSPEWVYSFYGLLRVGYVPVLLSTKNNEAYLKDVISRLNLEYIISDKSYSFIKNINPFDIKNTAEVEESWENEVIFTTSGTTGKCRIVSYNGKQLINQIYNAEGIIKKNYLISKSYKGYLKHLLILPLFHVFGFIAVFLWFSFFNVTSVIPYKITPQYIRQAALISEATHVFAVPLFWKTISNEILKVVKKKGLENKFNKGINLSIFIQKLFPKSGIDFVKNKLFKKYLKEILGPSICFCINGGASLDKETFKIINALGYPLVNGYGSTEIGITSFANSKSIKNRMVPSIGNPFDNVRYKINENNELEVSSLSISTKIMENEEWKIASQDLFINTSDSVYKIKESYFFKGRVDEIIVNENGENYSLKEIEDSVSLLYCDSYIALQDKKTKEINLLISYQSNIHDFRIKNDILHLLNKGYSPLIKNIYVTRYIFPKANDIKIIRSEVINHFYFNKEDFKIINKDELININCNDCDKDILKTIKDLFKSVLNIDDVKDNSNFYSDLNGDSLRYFMLLEAIKNTFNIEIEEKEKLPLTPLEFSKEIMEALS